MQKLLLLKKAADFTGSLDKRYHFKNIKKVIMPEALGMVINPYGFNLVVQLQHFDNLLARFGMSAE